MLDQTYHFWEKMTIKKDEPEVHLRTKTNVIFGVCLFVFSKLFTLSSGISIQKSDLEQNKKGYSLSISPIF